MIISKTEVSNLIRHREPFVMVDNLISASMEEIKSDFFIDSNNVLIENNVFSDSGLIENIAQTCAAGFGFLDAQNGEEAKLGFIGAINKLKTHNNPQIGESITTEVKILQQFENVILIKGVNYLNGTAQLECEMKIVIIE